MNGVGIVALVTYAAVLGHGFRAMAQPRRYSRNRPRSLGAAARRRERGAASLGVLALAAVAIVSAAVLIDHGKEIPPQFTLVLSTVSAWVGAGAPKPRKPRTRSAPKNPPKDPPQ